MMKTHFEKTNPPGTKYLTLKTRKATYYCNEWKDSRKNGYCMYYVVQGVNLYIKRIPLNELHAAEKHLRKYKKFNRNDSREQCPIATSCGDCSFAVIGGILENSCNAEYNADSGFVLRE